MCDAKALFMPWSRVTSDRSVIDMGSIGADADYTKVPWGQSKCFANGDDGSRVHMR